LNVLPLRTKLRDGVETVVAFVDDDGGDDDEEEKEASGLIGLF